MIIEVPEDFQQFVDATIVRISYLYPGHTFTTQDSSIRVSFPDDEPNTSKGLIRKEIFYQLYRQRIYEETLPIRKWLYSTDE